MREYTLRELAIKAGLRARRSELMRETLYLMHGDAADQAQIVLIDAEIAVITAELGAM